MGTKELVLVGETPDIIAELSLAANKNIMIQNKTSGRILVYPNDTPPVAGTEGKIGFFVKCGECFTVPPNAASKCFVTGNGGNIVVLNY